MAFEKKALLFKKKKTLFFTLVTLVLLGCGHTIMTLESFEDVPLGMSVGDLKKSRGTPYAIRKLEEGKLEYEYIERIPVNGRVGQERHYFFLIENGEVVGKRSSVEQAPPYWYNSYDLQTSQHEEEEEKPSEGETAENLP